MGETWTPVIADTATSAATTNQFSQRSSHSSVAISEGQYQGIYVIGGIDASTGYLDDVWKWEPEDGTTWTQTTSNTSSMKRFKKRVDHTSFVIDDIIYIIGGREGTKQRSGTAKYWDDVCKLTDGGKTWVEIQAIGGSKFSKRDDHSSVVIEKGKYKGIYVIGGFETDGKNLNTRDDVWKSTDLGQTWRNVHTIPQGLRPAQG